MNTEDFVTYEQAVKLKELGFDWRCMEYYTNNYVNDDPEDLSREVKFNHGCLCNQNIIVGYFSAPTLSQAAKWLREVKGIIIVCTPEINKLDCNDYFIGEHYTGRWYCESESTIKTYSTYEEALSAGISAALKLIN